MQKLLDISLDYARLYGYHVSCLDLTKELASV